jgi:hypothetical protein
MPNGTGGNWGAASQGSQWLPPSKYTGPPKPPVITRFVSQGQPLNAPGPVYAAPTPYQQFPATAPPVQAYAPLQSPYPQQYGPSGTPYAFNQLSPQPYSTPPTPQYGNPGYQPPNTPFQPPNVPQQYGGSGIQNIPHQVTPAPVQYQPPRVNTYPPQSGIWNGQAGQQQTPQWNKTSRASSFSNPGYQPQNQIPQASGYAGENSGTPRAQSQVQQTPKSEHKSHPVPRNQASTLDTVVPSVERDPSLPNESSPLREPSFVQNPPEATTSVKDEPEAEAALEQLPESKSPIHESVSESTLSSRASTPFKGYGSPQAPLFSEANTSSSPSGTHPKQFEAANSSAGDAGLDKVQESSELIDSANEHEQWNWEYKKIFKERQTTETVALAQPLSFTFDSTPVPLLNSSRWSVSRYARQDNQKEYIKSIRSQPQWSYLQEDPGYSDSVFDGPLIPLDEVPSWMAARHGEEVHDFSKSRKRERSVTADDEDDTNSPFESDSPVVVIDEKPAKRQKHVETSDEDTIIQESEIASEIACGVPGTPTVARIGTPTIDVDGDDVWAIQPGEGAAVAKEMDPTEVLLRSLGVEGSPKPVRRRSKPSLRASLSLESTDKDRSASPTYGSIPQSMSPQLSQALSMPPQSHPYNVSLKHSAPQSQPVNGFSTQSNNSIQSNSIQSNGIQPNGTQPNGIFHSSPPQNTPSFHNTQNFMPPQAQYPNEPLPNGPQHNPGFVNTQYNIPPHQNSYVAPPQTNVPYTNHPNNMPPQNSYGNNAMVTQSNPSYPNQSYPNQPYQNQPYQNQPYAGLPQQNLYGNGVPSQGFPQYGNGAPQQGYPPQNQYVNGVTPPTNTPYGMSSQIQGAAPYGPSHHTQPIYPISPQGQATPYGEAQYGSNTQGNPQYGGPQQGYYSNGGPPQVNPTYNIPTQSMPQQGPPQPLNNPPQSKQARQDSGYVSARGSYSNQEPEMTGVNNLTTAQSELQQHESSDDTPVNAQVQSQQTLDDDQDDAALSPISMELLGKFHHPPPVKAVSGRKPEPMRQPDDGGTAVRKPKRPQPVVAPAYR